jgi:nucleoside 2-deoxyribosyltransferase
VAVNAYLAGPEIFLPRAGDHARRKIAICGRYGIIGRTPLNEDIVRSAGTTDAEFAVAIFRKDLAMMQGCDIIIANLTPFRGASADSGTLVEVGWFLGRGRPVFGYSNTATPFADRSRVQVAALPDPLPGIVVEGFGLPDNLMIPCAVLDGGGYPMVLPDDGKDRAFDALDVFACCVAAAAHRLGVKSDAGGSDTPDLHRMADR